MKTEKLKSSSGGKNIDKKFLAVVAALAAAFALLMKLVTMASASTASDVPSLFVNDTVFRYHEDFPLEMIKNEEYVPVIFFEFLSASDVEVKYVDNGFYILYKRTNRYIAFETDTDYGTCGTLSMYFYCPTYMINKARYVPLALVADYLGILYETDRYYGVARIKDKSAGKSLDQLIAKYTEPPTTATVEPPSVNLPPLPPPISDIVSNPEPNTEPPATSPEVTEPVPVTTQPSIIDTVPHTTSRPTAPAPAETEAVTMPPETTTEENTDSVLNYFIFKSGAAQNHVPVQDMQSIQDIQNIQSELETQAAAFENIERFVDNTDGNTGDDAETGAEAETGTETAVEKGEEERGEQGEREEGETEGEELPETVSGDTGENAGKDIEKNIIRNEKIDFLVELLKKEDIKSVFFFTGAEILENPAIVRKVYAAGHDIGITIEDGKINPSPESMLAELEKTNALIYTVTKRKTRFYLFDENLYDDDKLKESCTQDLEKKGYYAIAGNLDASAHSEVFEAESADMDGVINLLKQSKINVIKFDVSYAETENGEHSAYAAIELIAAASRTKFYINISRINNANIENLKEYEAR